jgi:hypothetical protein
MTETTETPDDDATAVVPDYCRTQAGQLAWSADTADLPRHTWRLTAARAAVLIGLPVAAAVVITIIGLIIMWNLNDNKTASSWPSGAFRRGRGDGLRLSR